jgi:hypothetical protein
MAKDWKAQLAKLMEELNKPSAVPNSIKQTAASPNRSNGTSSEAKAVSPSYDSSSGIASNGSKPSPGGNGVRKAPAIDAILGVDFGTRYTKVALSLPHIERREILSFGSMGRLLPSRLVIDDRGYVAGIRPRPGTQVEKSIEYLKIRLANPQSEAFGVSMSVGSVTLPDAIKALSAYFLAIVFKVSISAARGLLPQELDINRAINWSANVGVPVKHCDGEALGIFREVARVAWEWASRAPPQPLTAGDLVRRYDETSLAITDREMPVSVAPELAAGLVHFAEQRNTPEGLYAFVDVGGATVDGSIFRLSRTPEGSRFEILSAEVDELGTMAVARQLVASAYLSMSDTVEKPIIFGGVEPKPILQITSETEKRIQAAFARVVGEARKKLPGEHFESLSNTLIRTRPGLNKPLLPIIPVYMAGGGCGSEWYRQLIARVHGDFQHEKWGVGGYEIQTVPPPVGVVDDDYPRFVIALGLTSQSLHFEKYLLPSQIRIADPSSIHPGPTIAYEDTKDIT